MFDFAGLCQVDCRGETRRHEREQLALDGEKCGRLVEEEARGAVRQHRHRGPQGGQHRHRRNGKVRGGSQGEQQESKAGRCSTFDLDSLVLLRWIWADTKKNF